MLTLKADRIIRKRYSIHLYLPMRLTVTPSPSHSFIAHFYRRFRSSSLAFRHSIPLTPSSVRRRHPLSVCLSHSMSTSTPTVTHPSSLSDACCDPGAGALSGRPQSMTGKDVIIAQIHCYSVGDSSTAVVMVSTDVFGYQFPPVRSIADQIAGAGFHVLIPDLFEGDAVTLQQANREYIRNIWSKWPKHTQEATAQFLTKVAQELKKEGKAKSIQTIGYCYGAVGALALLKEGLASSAVLAHPSRLSKDNADLATGPTLFLCAETDESFPPDVVEHWRQTLQDKGVPAKFIHFPGTNHGFAVRDDGTPHGLAEKQRAVQETIAFLQVGRSA